MNMVDTFRAAPKEMIPGINDVEVTLVAPVRPRGRGMVTHGVAYVYSTEVRNYSSFESALKRFVRRWNADVEPRIERKVELDLTHEGAGRLTVRYYGGNLPDFHERLVELMRVH